MQHLGAIETYVAVPVFLLVLFQFEVMLLPIITKGPNESQVLEPANPVVRETSNDRLRVLGRI
jgi:hypothetical protein